VSGNRSRWPKCSSSSIDALGGFLGLKKRSVPPVFWAAAGPLDSTVATVCRTARPDQSKDTVVILGIDIGKNTFHFVGFNKRGAIVLRQKLSRRQLEARLATSLPALSAWRPVSAPIT